ncbi:Multi antimicrobial extrusion protein (Na(+)/drug antiporter), MATE family of MDR efflux pump [Lachnospiraceae bacterium TWA4]|nr:Multi antimicrobial extrusion protein (Na(+)/drug antiporter), MATE family of MDR efflux pump [Lachnospiraceae bacterium TWA4]
MENEIFEKMPVRKAYMKFSLPVVFSMVISLVYNMVDTYFIAHTYNKALVAGVSLCAPIFTLMIALGDILGLGGSSVISRLFGMQKEDDGKRLSAFCFYGSIGGGLVVTAIMLLFKQPILTLLGAKTDTFIYASQYYFYLVLGAPLIILNFAPSNLLRTEGLAKESMFGTIFGSVVNMILDPIFIFGLGMGAGGAAIANRLGYLSADIAFVVILKKKSKKLSVNLKQVKVSKRELVDMLSIGIPASITNLMQSLCMMLTNRFLLSHGTDSIAAMGIVMKINMIAALVLVGFSFGPQPLIGYNYGAGNGKRLKEVLSFGYKFEFSLALIFTAILSIFARPILQLFMNDANIVSLGVPMLRLQQMGMAFMAIVLVTTCAFQSTGKALGAFILSASRQGVVFAIVLVIASTVFGYYGILTAQATSDFLTAIIAVLLYRKLLKSEID